MSMKGARGNGQSSLSSPTKARRDEPTHAQTPASARATPPPRALRRQAKTNQSAEQHEEHACSIRPQIAFRKSAGVSECAVSGLASMSRRSPSVATHATPRPTICCRDQNFAGNARGGRCIKAAQKKSPELPPSLVPLHDLGSTYVLMTSMSMCATRGPGDQNTSIGNVATKCCLPTCACSRAGQHSLRHYVA